MALCCAILSLAEGMVDHSDTICTTTVLASPFLRNPNVYLFVMHVYCVCVCVIRLILHIPNRGDFV